MDNLSFLLGLNANNGGGGGSTPTWSEVTGKPFSTVDTTNGLTIVDGTLMLETLDHVATIDYVDGQIDGITTTLESDYALKSEIPDVSDFITASALTPYAESADLAAVATSGSYNDLADKPTIPQPTSVTVTQGLTTGVTVGSIDVDGVTTTLYAPQGGGSTDWDDITNKPTFATVATSGDYEDLTNKPTIPTVPTNVSSFTNDAGYVTSAVTTGLATEAYVNAATTALNIPDAVSVSQTLQSGTAIADITVGDTTTTLYAPAGGSGGSSAWADITNKPSIASGYGTNSIVEGLISGNSVNTARGNYAHAEGYLTAASGNYTHVEGVGTIANGGEAQHVQGKYNAYNNSPSAIRYADIVGNGTSDNNLSNAEATDWGGNKYLAGNIYTNVTNWASPITGAACIPPQADFDWASANGYVNNAVWDEAQAIVDEGGTDEQSNPEYLGVVGSYVFRYSPNHSSLDPEQDFYGYFWECDYAEAEPNPNYNPEGGGDEPNPEEPEPEEP